MTWKKVNNADAGTATKFGGNDLDKVSDLFSGTDVDDVDINADFSVRSSKRKLRNPANTFDYIEAGSAITANRTVTEPLLTGNDTRAYEAHTQTFTNKTMSNDSNTFAHVGAYNAIIYKSGSVYKAKKGDGTLIASSTTLDAVVQSALDLKGLIVWVAASDGSAYAPTAVHTGWEMSPGTSLVLSQDTRVSVPETSGGITLFKINDAYGGAHKAHSMMIKGGFFQQSGVAPDALWTFLHMQSSSSTANSAGVYQNTIRDVYVKRCLYFIRLTANTGTQSWVNGNQFDNIWCDYPHWGIVFEQDGAVGSSIEAVNRNNFNNVVIQGDQGEVTGPYAMLYGIKDISGVNNVFTNCHMWDVVEPNAACNITNKAENTIIEGGIMTNQPYDWEVSQDFGLRTIIIGADRSGGTGAGISMAELRPDIRKTGAMVGAGNASSNVQASGLLSGINSEGTLTNVRNTSGIGKKIDTTTTINTRARIGTPTTCTIRYWNPIYRTRLMINQSTAQRVFVGFSDVTTLALATGEDPLPNLTGFGLYHSTTSGVSATNWLMCRNNGGASSTITDTGVAVTTSAPINLYLALWEDGPKAQWRVGTTAVGEATTVIPGQTTGMCVGNYIGNTTAASKTLDTFQMFIKNSKSEEWF